MRAIMGTGNFNKSEEMRIIAENYGDVALYDSVWRGHIEETADDYLGNAIIKAVEYFNHDGRLTISDDSGLEIDALNGEPGVKSVRYAGRNATMEDNILMIDGLLSKYPPGDVKVFPARCVCVMVAAGLLGVNPDPLGRKVQEVPFSVNGVTCIWTMGVVEGAYLVEPRGLGWGYEAHFMPNAVDLTFAQMNRQAKARYSHRAGALTKMFGALEYWGQ